MEGKRIILYKQSWNTWLDVLIIYTKGPFMEVVDFIIKASAMTYSDYWTVIKLWIDKGLYKNAVIL